jgi:hypothetical protein
MSDEQLSGVLERPIPALSAPRARSRFSSALVRLLADALASIAQDADSPFRELA